MIWNGPPPRTNDEWQQYIAMHLGEGVTIQEIVDGERADAVEEATSGPQWHRIRDLKAERDTLRAILAPLLEDPIRWMGSEWDNQCLFCGSLPHSDDCPVLRRDELLGRVHPNGVRA